MTVLREVGKEPPTPKFESMDHAYYVGQLQGAIDERKRSKAEYKARRRRAVKKATREAEAQVARAVALVLKEMQR